MKQTLIAIALLTSVAACTKPAEKAADAANTEQSATKAAEPKLLADIGGKPTGPVYTKEDGDTLALSGYDPVSYFTGKEPVAGSADFTVRYQGFDYRFANAENAKTFQASPDKYAPQYGGYCAWAIGANDALAPTDPKVYKIVDGKLYLNNSASVAKVWEKDVPGFISKGNGNYPKHDAKEHYATN